MFNIFKKKKQKEIITKEQMFKDCVIGTTTCGKTYNQNLEYEFYLKLLEEKAKDAIPITETSDNLRSLGQYVEEYPQMHRVEVFEDDDKKIYRLDLK